MSIVRLFTVFMTLKTFFQNVSKDVVQTLPQPRQLREVQAPLKVSCKKLLVTRNTKASKKRNGLIMLTW